jgi:glutamine synthetase
MDPTMGDLLAVPDPSTLTPLPWRPEVGWLSCNLVHEDTELAHGPRNVLRSVQSQLAAEGLTLKTGVECEFFILEGGALPSGATSATLSDPMDTQSKPCYDAQALFRRHARGRTPAHTRRDGTHAASAHGPLSATVRASRLHACCTRYELIAELCEHMEALGWGAYQADHEDANGQFEINWDFNDCLVTADRVTFFKYMVWHPPRDGA